MQWDAIPREYRVFIVMITIALLIGFAFWIAGEARDFQPKTPAQVDYEVFYDRMEVCLAAEQYSEQVCAVFAAGSD